MNINKILDKIPYETFANFKPAHYFGIFAGIVVLIFGLMFFLVFSPNAEEKARLDKKLKDTEQTLKTYLAEGKQKEAVTKQVAALYGTLGEKKRQLPLAEEIPLVDSQNLEYWWFPGRGYCVLQYEAGQERGFLQIHSGVDDHCRELSSNGRVL